MTLVCLQLASAKFVLCSCRIDDIQDNSVLRRGIPVAHNIYGTASTINAANYVLFIALERLIALNHPEVKSFLENSIFFVN